MATTDAPTTPVAAASKAPTNTTASANPPRTEQEITDVLTGKVGSDALADFDRRLNERKARLFAEEPPLSERQRGEKPPEPPYGFEDGSETKAEVERRLPMTLEAAAALYEG